MHRYVDVSPVINSLNAFINDPTTDDHLKDVFAGFRDILMNLDMIDVVPESRRLYFDSKWHCGRCGKEIEGNQNYCATCGGRIMR